MCILDLQLTIHYTGSCIGGEKHLMICLYTAHIKITNFRNFRKEVVSEWAACDADGHFSLPRFLLSAPRSDLWLARERSVAVLMREQQVNGPQGCSPAVQQAPELFYSILNLIFFQNIKSLSLILYAQI